MLKKKHIKFFESLLPEDYVYSEPGDCWAYGYDNSKIHVMPECVLFSENKLQIQEIVKYCYLNNIHITSRGRGTGNTGGSVPIDNSIVLSLEKMNKIIDGLVFYCINKLVSKFFRLHVQDSLTCELFFNGKTNSIC